jgi:LacI family transcriptional regulator
MPRRQNQKSVILALGQLHNETVHRGVARFARRNNWHLSAVFGESPDLLENRFCNGIIAVLNKESPMTKAILQRRLPTVGIGTASKYLKMPHVTGHNVDMGRTAAKYLMDRGFRHFFWYAEFNHQIAEDRFKGYSKQLHEQGFTPERLVLPEQFPREKPSWQAQQEWIAEALRSGPLPAAVYAFNDLHAVNVIDTCSIAGLRIPDEVAVLGTDDNPLICPTAAVPLSSIQHDLEMVGYRAAQELEKIFQGARQKYQVIRVPHRGIAARQSTNIFAVNDPDVVAALNYIHENFSHRIGVTEIATASGLSRRTLEARFKRHMKKSILGTLNDLRIENCCQLLRETDLSIADIAAQSGYNTPEYLHRVFLKSQGLTPRHYRIQARNAEEE